MLVAGRDRLDVVPLNGEAGGRCFVEDLQDRLERFQQSPLEILGNFRVRSGRDELNDRFAFLDITHLELHFANGRDPSYYRRAVA